MMERTLVIVKPDGVQRALVGKIISRFEDAGFKIVGLKMKWADRDFAMKHYTEDLARRRGEHVRKQMVEFISSGPVIAVVLEGVNAVQNVRKITGDTQPMAALPGTIRGDFSHVSYEYADSKKIPVKNIIHASSRPDDAKAEIALWFGKDELHSYKSVHDEHTLK
ncbi:nucleoside-diphosphate kinase [Candidatus Woesearchaeota archaeon]|nr:nucleoside-diphosphate kinase [Candidatus Woesearchaeota archaeon]